MLEVKWKGTNDNGSDIFTKNLSGMAFAHHCKKYCGDDEYDLDEFQGESGGGDELEPMQVRQYD